MELLERTDDCEAFSFERRIVSLRWRQFLREERDATIDSTVIPLQQHGADCDFSCICVEDKRLLEVGVSESRGCTESSFDFVE